MHDKKKRDGVYVNRAQQGVAQSPQAPVEACVKKVMNRGDRSYFLYLASWSVPRMFRNVKNLWKNVT